MVNPVPATLAVCTVTAAVPLEVSTMDCVAGVLSVTLPKATLVALTVNAGPLTAGLAAEEPSCRLKAAVAPPSVAVRETFCVPVTALTVALKDAVVLPAAMLMLAGTATALLSLASATETPPDGAGVVSVTEQGSVPAVVTVLLAHESDCSAAVLPGVAPVGVEVVVDEPGRIVEPQPVTNRMAAIMAAAPVIHRER